jgi:pyruvate kinase
MIEAGMNVARLNFSHGNHAEHRETIHTIREAADRMGRPVAVLQDLSGPKIRVRRFAGGPVQLNDGDDFILTVRDVPGNEREVSVNYSELPRVLHAGNLLLLSDGVLEFEVTRVEETDIHCRVVIGGSLSSNKGINLPMGSAGIPSLTDKDRDDLAFGLDQEVDYVALSFVRSADDILQARRLIREHGRLRPVIATIENIDDIVAAADGLMVARGDLGIEIPLEKVPTVQKMVITKANQAAKPVITATHMLASMVKRPRPTRAEVADVANAVLDGTDAIMLSEETAIGDYPVKTVRTMVRICDETEAQFPYDRWRDRYNDDAFDSVPEAISYAACEMASNLDAPVIVVFSRKGATSRMVARHRPRARILSVTPLEESYRQLNLTWGVVPVLIGPTHDIDEIVKLATQIARDSGHVKPGRRFIITGGLPVGTSETTNSITTATMPSPNPNPNPNGSGR